VSGEAWRPAPAAARARILAKRAEREADPGWRLRPVPDWRPQDIFEIEDLLDEGD